MTLRKLKVGDESAMLVALADWGHHPDLEFAFDFDLEESFADYVAKLERWSRGEDLPGNFVASTFLVGFLEDGRIVGRISIRHQLNDMLFRIGGHVGYMVLPSFRRQGYGCRLLRQAIPVACKLGVDPILITCDEDNVASRKIIEANGGRYENSVTVQGLSQPKRRYWIDSAADTTV